MEQKHHYTGLSEAQVLESREKNGANVLTPPEKDPLWKQFLEKFGDPLIIILMIAGALSIGISCYEFFGLGQGGAVFFEPAGIFVAILLATGLAFYFELQADKEFTILNQVNDDEPVEVIRNGNTTQIPRKEIVVGDIVILNTGEEVPADSELLEATSLHMDESTLTGEPMCGKSVDEKDFDKAATYPTNHVMKGTKVMEGHGICRVLAVGDKTEQGKVFEAVQIDDSVKTPLNEQLDGLSDWITKVSYGFAALIVIGRIIMYFVTNGTDCFGSMEQIAPFIAYVLQTLMIAVTLVVVAVPEGLPMAVTLSLAYSMRRMLKTNNLVRKMHACETMGATTVICTDKTGTLTQNLMSVNEMTVYGDTPKDVLNEGIAVNSTASIDFSDESKPQVLGNPTEGALLLWMSKNGVDYRSIRESVKTVAEVPFSTERKYMATIVESVALRGKKVLYVKGAPEIVFSLCKDTPVSKEDVEKQLTEYQNHAMRTLGFAYQVLGEGDKAIEGNKVVADKLCFIGVAAIADPVRLDVPSAVKECVDAGISVKIVTGDTPGTAKEIARQIGLWNDAEDTERNIITGPEFAALPDAELQERILDLKIISRARPMDKKRLVETLQKKSQVVAVTGDGTNDAPALRAAHVGLSMGDGTSVAKEASDITIIDNSFSSIGKAVMWGRSLYQNIQRFLLFQLTVNVTADSYGIQGREYIQRVGLTGTTKTYYRTTLKVGGEGSKLSVNGTAKCFQTLGGFTPADGYEVTAPTRTAYYGTVERLAYNTFCRSTLVIPGIGKTQATTVTLTPVAGTAVVIEKPYILGDVNGDGSVTVNDIVKITQYVLGTSHEIDTAAADVNVDGSVTVTDIVYVTYYILYGVFPSQAQAKAFAAEWDMEE